MNIFCDKCGYPVERGSEYCHNCGDKIERDSQGISPTRIDKGLGVSKNSNFSPIAYTALALVIISVVIGFIYTTLHKSKPIIESMVDTSLQETSDLNKKLSIFSISPNTLIAPYNNLISLNGEGFTSDSVVKISGKVVGVSGAITSSLIYVQYKGDLGPGMYDVVIINPNGEEFSLKSGLRIQASGNSKVSSYDLSTSQITSKVKPSLVLIRTQESCGSGMIVRSDGVILTSDHVVSGNSYVNVYLSNGTFYSGQVWEESPSQDLALVKINSTGLQAVTFTSSDNSSLNLGSAVLALGYPLTCNEDQTLVVEPGIVTARRNSTNFGELIQTSARVNPGASGGPLVNSDGNVVGINEAIITVLNIDLNITGMAFAIPSATINSFLSRYSIY